MTDSSSDSTDLTVLASSDAREAAVGRLSLAFAEDVLPMAEFERRVSEVWRVSTAAELAELTRDLPTGQETAAVPAARPAQSLSPAQGPPQRIRSVMSNLERSFHGPVPARLSIQATMASVELDLSHAEFSPGVTEIHLKAVMGSIEIELPDHVQVEDHGRSFIGSFVVRTPRQRRDRSADAPVVRITGRALLSSVEVEVDD